MVTGIKVLLPVLPAEVVVGCVCDQLPPVLAPLRTDLFGHTEHQAAYTIYTYYRALVSASAMTGRELNWGTEVDRRSSDLGRCGRKVGDLGVFYELASSSSVMDPRVYTQMFEIEGRLYPLACEGIGHDHPQEQCRA